MVIIGQSQLQETLKLAFLLEMENPCPKDTALDENGCPFARQKDHGIGSKSVIAFAKKYDGRADIQNRKQCFSGTHSSLRIR